MVVIHLDKELVLRRKSTCKKDVDRRIGQIVATAITYSYIQIRRQPQNNILTATLNVSSHDFYAILYDTGKDYFLCTEAFRWNAASIVILRAILNHQLTELQI